MANTREVMGEQACLDALIAGTTITELEDDEVYELNKNALSYNTSIRSVRLPSLKTVKGHSFSYSPALETIDLPSCTEVEEYAFYCDYRATVLRTVRIGAKCSIKRPFVNANAIEALILEADEMCTLFNNISGTVTANDLLGSARFAPGGAATVYVPASMLATYQADPLWSVVDLAAIEV